VTCSRPVQPCREILLDAKIRICEIRSSSRSESFALPDVRPKRSLGRIATLAMLGLGMLGAAGWLAIRETPAAQRVVETIKPYDPLQ
jgi:hypothetical protein